MLRNMTPEYLQVLAPDEMIDGHLVGQMSYQDLASVQQRFVAL